jgi:O-antigen/teichoic acid export membrane protein
MIFVTRILAKELGPDEFGIYSLARRMVSFVLPFSTLSMGVALARYIAVSDNKAKRNDYIVSAMLIVLCFSFLLVGAAFLMSRNLTILIFHSSQYLTLFYCCVFMIVGFGSFIILYAYYRGIQRMDWANLWQVCIIAILPLAIAYAFAQYRNISLIIFLMGLSTYLSIFPLIVIIKKVKKKKLKQLRLDIKDLLKYGIPRTPGGVAFAGVLAIGPFLAPYFGTMKDAGYLVIGQSVFIIIEASVLAFGLVALPTVSQIFSEGRIEFLQSRISDILTMIIHLGPFIVIQLFLWSNEIVLIWLGNEYLKAVPIIKIFLVSLCPYLGYVMLRSVIDAIEERAINTLNLFISLGITAVSSLAFGFMGFGVLGLALGITIGLLSLGIFSTYFLVKRYKITFKNLELMWILFANCLFAGVTIITKKYLVVHFDNIKLLISVFLIGSLLFIFYMWLLYKKDIEWVMQLKIRIFSVTI